MLNSTYKFFLNNGYWTSSIAIFFSICFFVSPGHSEPFVSPNGWLLSPLNSELLNKNERIGPQFVADVSFVKWIDIPLPRNHPDSYIGLTKDGELYLFVDYKERKVLRLLSGEKQLQDFYFSSDGKLVGVDSQKRIYIFDHAKWLRPIGKDLVIQGFKVWSLLVGIATSVVVGTSASMVVDNPELVFALSGGLASAAALSAGLTRLQLFDYLNTHPDGFVATHYYFESLDQLNELAIHKKLETPSEKRNGSGHKSGIEKWAPRCLDSLLPKMPSELSTKIKL